MLDKYLAPTPKISDPGLSNYKISPLSSRRIEFYALLKHFEGIVTFY